MAASVSPRRWSYLCFGCSGDVNRCRFSTALHALDGDVVLLLEFERRFRWIRLAAGREAVARRVARVPGLVHAQHVISRLVTAALVGHPRRLAVRAVYTRQDRMRFIIGRDCVERVRHTALLAICLCVACRRGHTRWPAHAPSPRGDTVSGCSYNCLASLARGPTIWRTKRRNHSLLHLWTLCLYCLIKTLARARESITNFH